MTAKKKQKKAISPSGYRQFMAGFSDYARENGIHIHGGRGSFAKKAGEVWRDLKGKPAWKENLDIVLPQYLAGVEGAPEISPQDRLQAIIEEFSTQQFEWWAIKNLFGLWSESINVNQQSDRLMVANDEDDSLMHLATDFDAFNLYNAYKEMSNNGQFDSDSAPYLRFVNAELNDQSGIDVFFMTQASDGYIKRIHETASTFNWSPQVKEKFKIQSEAIGKKGARKISQMRISPKGAAKQAIKEPGGREPITKTKMAVKKLEELNRAVKRVEDQYAKGVISKSDYKKILKNLYKL